MRGKRLHYHFAYLIFSIAFSFATLSVTQIQANTSENCLDVLQRLTQTTSDIIRSTRFPISASIPELVGTDSLHSYSADWSAHVDPERSYSQIAFSYVSSTGEEATLHIKLNPFQTLRRSRNGMNAFKEREISGLSTQSEAHLVHWELPRDSEGSFVDLNIAEEILKYLNSKSVMHERFSFVLNDPGIVQALNQTLSQLLKSIEFGSDFPRISGTDDDPLAQHFTYDIFQDSYFPSIQKPEIEKILSVLESHLGLEKELLATLLKTKFGESLRKSGEWDIQIRIEGFSLTEALKLHESDLYPYVFRYRIELVSLW